MSRLAIQSLLLLLAACGTKLSYVPLNTSPKAMLARDPSTVEMFTSSKPERPFVEIAILEAQQESAYSVDGETTVFAKLRQEGASRGCDGLVLLGPNDSVVGSTTGSVHRGYGTASGFTTTLRGYRATCIAYKDPGASPTTPAANVLSAK